MEFDWLDIAIDTAKIQPRELEEAFEDPFSIRVLPESPYGDEESRFILLGRTLDSRSLFVVFWSDGKKVRVIAAREMTDQENHFYDRRNAELL